MVGNLKACPGDADFFRLDIPADTEVQLSALFDAKRAPLSLKHHPEDGAEMKSSLNKRGAGTHSQRAIHPKAFSYRSRLLVTMKTITC